MIFYSEHINKLIQSLNTDKAIGLSDEDVLKQIKIAGKNKLVNETSRNWAKILFAQFNNLLVILLMVACVLSFQLGASRDGIVLAIIVLVNALIGFYQDWKAENILQSLKSLIIEKCNIIRSGKQKEIPVEDLVIGDVVIINEGDGVPADIRLFESNSLYANEFILTGESQASKKYTFDELKDDVAISEQINMLFMGTTIARGNAKGIVVATGMDTEIGKIAGKSQKIKQDISPLQKEINIVAKKITILTLILGVVLFAFSLMQGAKVAAALVFSISIAAAMVPEGLPAQISIALALGVRRLAAKNAVVKQLSSVEALGSATVIASDKTGTITKNEMSIVSCSFNGNLFNITGTGYNPIGYVLSEDKRKLTEKEINDNKLFFTIGYLSSSSSVNPPDEFHKSWYGIGDPTECAFCALALKAGFYADKLEMEYETIQMFPFDSERKRISIIRKHDGKNIVFAKGSIESILDVCNTQSINNRIVTLSVGDKNNLLKQAEHFAEKALRVIAISYKEIPIQDNYSINDVESNLIFAGFAAMFDPPKDEVSKAIQDAFAAKIKVLIITGDNEVTAKAIASAIHLNNNDGTLPQIINKNKLLKLSDVELKEILQQQTLIFSRVSPDDKLRIVTLLKEMGEVVAVTGDGVNDTLSLKKADIGTAMGLNGSKVAQEAAAMVLLDDNFSTIIHAIKEGRVIFDNIKKNIAATLASNVAELTCVLYGFIGAYMGQPVAILAIHILLIDLIGEMLPLLTLAFDKAEDGIMTKPPRKQGQLLNNNLILQVLVSGVIRGLCAVMCFNGIYSNHSGELNQHQIAVTGTFVCIIITQFTNILSIRSSNHIFNSYTFSNKYLLFGMLISMLCMLGIIYTPFLNVFLHTGPLRLKDWIYPLESGIVYLLAFEAYKFIIRKSHHLKIA